MAVIGELLFFRRDQVDLDTMLRHQTDVVLPKLVDRLAAPDLEKLTDDEAVQLLTRQAQVMPLAVAFDEAKADVKEIAMQVRDVFGGVVTVKGLRATKRIPYSGDSQLWHLRPNSYDLNPPRGEVKRDAVIIGMEVREHEADQAVSYIEDTVSKMKVYLDRQAAQLTEYFGRLPTNIRPLVQRRRSLHGSAGDLLKKLQGKP